MASDKRLSPLPAEIALSDYLRPLGKVAIAFSGGCDSSLLAAFAADILSPDHVLLVHASTPMTFERENQYSRSLASSLGVRYLELEIDALQCADVVKNDKWRCYFCKQVIFGSIWKAAREQGFSHLLDGANVDDQGDWRPGAKAADEMGVLHPFTSCGIGKRLIRLMSRRRGLASWSMPAAACLASRIPTGTPLTREAITRAGLGESILNDLGYPGSRVRILEKNHASLEFRGPYLTRAIRHKEALIHVLEPCRFSEISIQPEGYRQGSMNAPFKLNGVHPDGTPDDRNPDRYSTDDAPVPDDNSNGSVPGK